MKEKKVEIICNDCVMCGALRYDVHEEGNQEEEGEYLETFYSREDRRELNKAIKKNNWKVIKDE